MRLVLDTNVLVSGLLWRGAPYHLLHAIRQRPAMRLFSSQVLIEELADVLRRPTPAARLALIGLSAPAVLAILLESVDLVEPRDTPAVIADDPDDDHVLAAAMAANADMIVSGDRHLLTLGQHQGRRILPPAAALSILNA